MIDGTAGVRGHRGVDESLLNDLAAIEAADPGAMLRHTASAGAQVRESAALAAEANLTSIADEGRPRALVLAVSASGRSPEALSAADAAARRGARLVAIGAPDSELESVAERARAPFIPVPRRGPARAAM